MDELYISCFKEAVAKLRAEGKLDEEKARRKAEALGVTLEGD